jgi:Ca2+-binding RTX toxin-like protein
VTVSSAATAGSFLILDIHPEYAYAAMREIGVGWPMSATIPGAPGGSSREALVWNGSAWVPISPVDQTNITNAAAGGNSISFYGSNLAATSGNDSFSFGSGNDFASGRNANDSLAGLDGNDALVGGLGADSLSGGAGADTLTGGQATVTGTLSDGNLSFTLAGDSAARDTLSGGADNDTYLVTSQGDVLSEGAEGGVDTMLLVSSLTTTYNDTASLANIENIGVFNPSSTVGVTLTANTGAQSIAGGEGSDILSGGDGNDTLAGAGGNDIISAGNDDDSIRGDAGNDILSAGGGSDTLVGGLGNDIMSGDTGADWLDATEGLDTASGNADADTLLGDGGDSLSGGSEDDLFIVSGAGNSIDGGTGTADALTFSNAGTYVVSGGPSNWTVTGPGAEAQSVTNIEFMRGAGGDTVFGAGSFFVCFAAGTRIMTAEGEVEVERLQAGDLVATLSGKGPAFKPVLWIGHRRIALAGLPDAAAIAPVRIRAGALGDGAPCRDLLVSPDHCMFLDGALVPARLLVNGRTITVERALAEITYFHVELERHDVLLAEGAAAESWLDCSNRDWFENAPLARLTVAQPLAESGSGWDAARACAPLVHGGPRLAAIREAIASRAIAPVTSRSAA